jgi:hypothetical protein
MSRPSIAGKGHLLAGRRIAAPRRAGPGGQARCRGRLQAAIIRGTIRATSAEFVMTSHKQGPAHASLAAARP